jgi:hypothetical protein
MEAACIFETLETPPTPKRLKVPREELIFLMIAQFFNEFTPLFHIFADLKIVFRQLLNNS